MKNSFPAIAIVTVCLNSLPLIRPRVLAQVTSYNQIFFPGLISIVLSHSPEPLPQDKFCCV